MAITYSRIFRSFIFISSDLLCNSVSGWKVGKLFWISCFCFFQRLVSFSILIWVWWRVRWLCGFCLVGTLFCMLDWSEGTSFRVGRCVGNFFWLVCGREGRREGRREACLCVWLVAFDSNSKREVSCGHRLYRLYLISCCGVLESEEHIK